jgi:hypothetical protein
MPPFKKKFMDFTDRLIQGFDQISDLPETFVNNHPDYFDNLGKL